MGKCSMFNVSTAVYPLTHTHKHIFMCIFIQPACRVWTEKRNHCKNTESEYLSCRRFGTFEATFLQFSIHIFCVFVYFVVFHPIFIFPIFKLDSSVYFYAFGYRLTQQHILTFLQHSIHRPIEGWGTINCAKSFFNNIMSRFGKNLFCWWAICCAVRVVLRMLIWHNIEREKETRNVFI